MPTASIHCPHCQTLVTAKVGELIACPACGKTLRIHQPGAGEEDEQLKRLLSRVKIVERVDDPPAETEEEEEPPPAKRPWWRFWG
jgi:uncharacterized Zn finger protein (UPF0148 family)